MRKVRAENHPEFRAKRPEKSPINRARLKLALADQHEREVIYRLRHDVYAQELAQHSTNHEGSLVDALDAFNV